MIRLRTEVSRRTGVAVEFAAETVGTSSRAFVLALLVSAFIANWAFKTVSHASGGVSPRGTSGDGAAITAYSSGTLRAGCRTLQSCGRVIARRAILGSFVFLVGRAVLASVADSTRFIAHLVRIIAIWALNGFVVLCRTELPSWAFRAGS